MPVTHTSHDLDARTLTIIADFAAPPARLWALYANPRQLERVWGPPSHPATFVDHELSVGARCTYFMTAPDGHRYHGFWEITEIDEPNRFCFEDGFADADFNAVTDMPVARSEYRFEAIETGTRATFTSTYASREALEKVLAMGVVEGATSAINQIDALLAEGSDG